MLTIFTIPKAFTGDMAVMQTNAIRSWTLLRPACEVILFGNDEGTAAAARKLGVGHIPEIECNEHGTPLMSSVFKLAHQTAKHPLLAFVNTDIILMSDFLPALGHLSDGRFLLVALRWDLDLIEPIEFEALDWEQGLRNRLAQSGRLHRVGGGGDCFIFPRGVFEEIPEFAIGRGAWDNWLIYQARRLKAPVIDATKAFTSVHQNHDYSHVQVSTGDLWRGPESKQNIELMGGLDQSFTTEYATHLLTPDGLKPALTPRHIYLRARAWPVLHPPYGFLLTPFKSIELAGKAFRKLGRTVRPAKTG